MALVNADGWGSLPVVVPVPHFATTGPMSDGAGGLLFEGVGGLYRISPTGELTVTTEIVLAVGQGDLLVLARGTGDTWRTTLRSAGRRDAGAAGSDRPPAAARRARSGRVVRRPLRRRRAASHDADASSTCPAATSGRWTSTSPGSPATEPSSGPPIAAG